MLGICGAPAKSVAKFMTITSNVSRRVRAPAALFGPKCCNAACLVISSVPCREENPNPIDNERLSEEINDGIARNKWVISCLKSDASRIVRRRAGQSGSEGKIRTGTAEGRSSETVELVGLLRVN